MDPLQSNEQEKDESALDKPQSIIIVSGTGEVHLQLEGSHTTSTETESVTTNCKEKRNVKFEDDLTKVGSITADSSGRNLKTENQPKENEKEIDCQEDILVTSGCNVNEAEDSNTCLLSPLDSCELKPIDQESKEIAERFKQIMEMFENFSKNLESLDLVTSQKSSNGLLLSSTKRKRPKSFPSKENIKKQRKTLEENAKVQQNGQLKADLNDSEIEEAHKESGETELLSIIQKADNPLTSTVSTNTSSCDFSFANKPSQSFGSQTLGSDHYSLNDLSLLEVSSITSHSEAPNSLNNYAHAENALETPRPLQTPSTTPKSLKVGFQETVITPLIESHNNWESPTQVVVEQPTTPNVHTIHIETNSTPSLSDLRREPLCQRLWTVLGDFCAATILCLQVNRDCIFCLGFFAAFVVSASFLTAFFYRTLSVSPSIWQASDNMRL